MKDVRSQPSIVSLIRLGNIPQVHHVSSSRPVSDDAEMKASSLFSQWRGDAENISNTL